ncbi:hypothetical protein MT340_009140 [Staphylococcus sp. NRL 16/872]|uniref:hypothetical protein n=1 Tax=Staphylococcus sp. NRL 16/872 TaxID=2930131 RepID=UPI001FB432FA|nr:MULTISPECIES: hypothetical protein [unclassified Staphylococcus]WEN68771.1 hypothetical protein MT340_009140 [Staphylococcus sp. NRL 16/872]
MSELEVVSDDFFNNTFEVTKESANNLIWELQNHKFTVENQQRELNKLGLIKREHAKWLHGKITVVQFAYNVEEIFKVKYKLNLNRLNTFTDLVPAKNKEEAKQKMLKRFSKAKISVRIIEILPMQMEFKEDE